MVNVNKVKFIVDNVHTTVLAHPQAEEDIRTMTRFRPEGYQFTALFKRKVWDGWTHLYNRKSKRLPTGLAPRVIKGLRRLGYEVTVDDQRERPDTDVTTDIELEEIELRPQQRDALEVAVKKGRGVIKANVGYGKSALAAALVMAYATPTLILVPTRDLLHQTKKEVERLLPDIPVGIVGDSIFEPKMVTVATLQSLATMLRGGLNQRQLRELRKDYNEGKLTQAEFEATLADSQHAVETRRLTIEWLKTFDLLLLDECHRGATAEKWASVLDHCPAYYRFGLSATPFKKTPGSELLLIGATGEMIYDYTLEDAVQAGISVPPLVFILDYPQVDLQMDAARKGKTKLSWQEVYEQGIVENRDRNQAILDACREAEKAGLPTMVLVSRVSHGKALAEELGWRFLSGSTDRDTRQSVYDRVNLRQLPGFISTVGNEGLNIRNLAMIVLAAGGKAEHTVMQRIGRGVRQGIFPYCVVIDFLDHEGHALLRKHTNRRLKVYKAERIWHTVVSTLPDLKDDAKLREWATQAKVAS